MNPTNQSLPSALGAHLKKMFGGYLNEQPPAQDFLLEFETRADLPRREDVKEQILTFLAEHDCTADSDGNPAPICIIVSSPTNFSIVVSVGLDGEPLSMSVTFQGQTP